LPPPLPLPLPLPLPPLKISHDTMLFSLGIINLIIATIFGLYVRHINRRCGCQLPYKSRPCHIPRRQVADKLIWIGIAISAVLFAAAFYRWYFDITWALQIRF
jgi:hypothetical protein